MYIFYVRITKPFCSLRKILMVEKENIPHGKEYLPQRFIPNLLEKNRERELKAAARIRFNEREMEK